jgi:glycine/D-amino acid oxidase-like deaminating enzyme
LDGHLIPVPCAGVPGVIGLTTAIEAIKKGHQVTVVAGHLPGYQGIEYTSAAAGAHHVSNAGADRRQRGERG